MTAQKILYVESLNDEHVCYALFKHYGVPDSFTVSSKDGLGNILKTLRLELKKEDEDRLAYIGVLVDADRDPAGRWRELMRLLDRFGYVDLPNAPDAAGTIITQADRPTLGIWLMPDNQLPGELEDFVQLLVPADDLLWPRAEQVVHAIPADERRFPTHDLIKAMMHTWLAWQAEPGRPMGYAIRRGFLNPDVPQAERLIAWIRRLFLLESA